MATPSASPRVDSPSGAILASFETGRATTPGTASPPIGSPRTQQRPQQLHLPVPALRRCGHCGNQVLRSSAAQHEARCKHRQHRVQPVALGDPHRRSNWQETKAPQTTPIHQPSPTEPCPSCGRLIACHGLAAHHQRRIAIWWLLRA